MQICEIKLPELSRNVMPEAKIWYLKGSTFSLPSSPGFFLGKILPCFHSLYWTHNILTLFSFQFIMFNTMITLFSFQFIEHYLTPFWLMTFVFVAWSHEVWTLGCVILFNHPNNSKCINILYYTILYYTTLQMFPL